MEALSNHLLSLILLTPFGGSLAVLFVSDRRAEVARWLAGASATVTLAFAVPLWFGYQPHGKTWQFAERGEWVPIAGASYYVGVDGFSILLILLTCLIAWVAVLASWREIRTRARVFYALVLLLETGLLGVFMSLDFLQVFVFWVGALVAMWFLIRMSGAGRSPRSSMKFGLHMLVASLALLTGILILYFVNHATTGVYSFDITQLHTIRFSVSVQKWTFVAFAVAFAATLALFPLHSWLPDAQAGAPAGASALLAALMLKMGTYGFVRFSLPILPDASRDFAPAMAALALIALGCGALFAWAQRDWMRLLAYSTVAHMGFVTLGMFALTPLSVRGSMLHQINHGVAAAGLLLIAARVRDRTPTGAVASIGGPWKTVPLVATVSLIMTLGLACVPALNGFVSAVAILRGVYTVGKLPAAISALIMACLSAYTLMLYRRTMSGSVTDEAGNPFGDLSGREIVMFAPLVLLAVWIGLYPAPFVSRLETSMGRVVARVNPSVRTVCFARVRLRDAGAARTLRAAAGLHADGVVRGGLGGEDQAGAA